MRSCWKLRHSRDSRFLPLSGLVSRWRLRPRLRCSMPPKKAHDEYMTGCRKKSDNAFPKNCASKSLGHSNAPNLENPRGSLDCGVCNRGLPGSNLGGLGRADGTHVELSSRAPGASCTYGWQPSVLRERTSVGSSGYGSDAALCGRG